MDLDQLIKLIPGLGVSGVLVVLVYGIMKGWLVTGREHASLMTEMIAMRLEMGKLRDRDEHQQSEINDLRTKLADEQEQKVAAMGELSKAQGMIESLRAQVVDLRAAVGGQNAAGAMGGRA
jgi:hypothetical protein